MQDHDLRTVTYDSHELDRHGPVEVASLRLRNDSEYSQSDNATNRGTEGAKT